VQKGERRVDGDISQCLMRDVCLSPVKHLLTYCTFVDAKVRVKKGHKVGLVKLFSPLSTQLHTWAHHRRKQQYVTCASGWGRI